MQNEDGMILFDLEVVDFPGFYESTLWDWDDIAYRLREDFEERYGELLYNYLAMEYGGEGDFLDFMSDHLDRESYERDVCERWIEAYLSTLPLESIQKVGQIDLDKPWNYNYRGDRLYVEVSVAREELEGLFEKVVSDARFGEYLDQRFGVGTRLARVTFDWGRLDAYEDIQLSHLLHYAAQADLLDRGLNPDLNYEVLDTMSMRDWEGGVSISDLSIGFFEKVREKTGVLLPNDALEPFSELSWETRTNGQIRYIIKVDGKQEGVQLVFHEGGTLAERLTMHEGELEGERTRWHRNGFISETADFKEGLLDGVVAVWDEQGSILARVEYQAGLPHGSWETYYEEGRLRLRGEFRKGKAEGEWLHFYSDGRQASVTTYKGGIQEGPQTIFSPEGVLVERTHYHNNKEVGPKEVFEEPRSQANKEAQVSTPYRKEPGIVAEAKAKLGEGWSQPNGKREEEGESKNKSLGI